jgi:hypothetical protein
MMNLEADVQTIDSSRVMPTGQRGTVQGQVSRRTLWIIAGVAVAGLTMLALGANWIAFATLVPLLYVLPCAAMMFMCMKGMNYGQNAGNGDAVSPATIAPPPSGVET